MGYFRSQRSATASNACSPIQETFIVKLCPAQWTYTHFLATARSRRASTDSVTTRTAKRIVAFLSSRSFGERRRESFDCIARRCDRANALPVGPSANRNALISYCFVQLRDVDVLRWRNNSA